MAIWLLFIDQRRKPPSRSLSGRDPARKTCGPEYFEGTSTAYRQRCFHYWDKGNLATIGRAQAVADLGRLRISGILAWLAWLFVHVFFLIGFRNRFVVIFEWAWAYFTYQRGARLITGDIEKIRRR